MLRRHAALAPPHYASRILVEGRLFACPMAAAANLYCPIECRRGKHGARSPSWRPLAAACAVLLRLLLRVSAAAAHTRTWRTRRCPSCPQTEDASTWWRIDKAVRGVKVTGGEECREARGRRGMWSRKKGAQSGQLMSRAAGHFSPARELRARTEHHAAGLRLPRPWPLR
jgi:hypothetical protein